MRYSETYQTALKKPTGRKGKGWAHADEASMQAAVAQALGIQCCLNPQNIYDWANRHDISLFAQRKRLMVPDVLLVAVLNDWTIDRTEAEMKA